MVWEYDKFSRYDYRQFTDYAWNDYNNFANGGNYYSDSDDDIIESTLAFIKPAAVRAHLVEEIFEVIKTNLMIQKQMDIRLTLAQASTFYKEHESKSFFQEAMQEMTSGPLVAFKLTGRNAVQKWRTLSTNLRSHFQHSVTHSSANAEAAVRELRLMWITFPNQQRKLTFMLGVHPHLGIQSSLQKFANNTLYNLDVVKMIFQYMSPGDEIKSSYTDMCKGTVRSSFVSCRGGCLNKPAAKCIAGQCGVCCKIVSCSVHKKKTKQTKQKKTYKTYKTSKTNKSLLIEQIVI